MLLHGGGGVGNLCLCCVVVLLALLAVGWNFLGLSVILSASNFLSAQSTSFQKLILPGTVKLPSSVNSSKGTSMLMI